MQRVRERSGHAGCIGCYGRIETAEKAEGGFSRSEKQNKMQLKTVSYRFVKFKAKQIEYRDITNQIIPKCEGYSELPPLIN